MPYSAECGTAAWMSPMKLFEYMAARRAIIATDLPALRVHLEHERNALLAPPDDADALTRAVERLVRDPALAGRLAEASFRDVQPFTWRSRARAILDRFGSASASDVGNG